MRFRSNRGEDGEDGEVGKEGEEGEEEERSTVSPDASESDTEDDWFALISANADWTNIHTYIPQSDSGPDSDADSDTNSNTNSDTNSNLGVDLDLNSGAGSGSNLESNFDISAPIRPEDNVWNEYYLDFGNTLEPATPQQLAFGIRVPGVVRFVSVFVLTMVLITSIRQPPHLQPFVHHICVSIHSFSLSITKPH